MVFKRMLILALASSTVALAFNALRGEGGIPLIAKHPYEIFIPCPEARVEVAPITPDDVPEEGVLFVDARPQARYARGHIPGARSLPYDDLFDPSPQALKGLLAAHAKLIVVYGALDGALDTGYALAMDLVAKGVRGARPLEGGVEAWAASGRPFEGHLGDDEAAEGQAVSP
ncbi:rhodanese-like domain-containing protein [Myxococcota bacterium]|nr:rhodanese-like domain-containing protein [Myxococcota bacterium]MBU1430298.1 rhodanese-like domain-containing protein [Myxococcota bacterium]MBU1896262.1 rhodanese-like domain-containing protein [Myxococcota bacterium]